MMTPQEAEARVFTKASFGGYNIQQVDNFLDTLIEDYGALYQENVTLKSKMKLLVDKVEEYRSTEDAMRKALHSAQQMANELVQEGEAKKAAVIEAAVGEAKQQSDAVRAQLAQEEQAEQAKLDALRTDLANEQARLDAARTATAAYVAKLTEGIKTISGIILQYPFYAGIMAIMAASGLVTTISKVFVDVATPASLPFWGLISSFVINFFAPSAGGHWVIQGPFMIDAAREIGSALNQTTMAVMLGNAWNDLVQPFWILPALALSKLKLRDVMGYTVIMMLWVGVIHITAVLAWGYLTH